jgi:hypothetical protein
MGSLKERKWETVTGIGGFFFRAKDPKALGLWYKQHLGILPIPTWRIGSSQPAQAVTQVVKSNLWPSIPFPDCGNGTRAAQILLLLR